MSLAAYAASAPRTLKRRRTWMIVLSLALFSGFYALIMAWMNNFHIVIPNELYRSGQLNPGELSYYAQRHGLRSVLNLRGDNSGKAWYDTEAKEATNAGVELINFRMSSKQPLTRTEALQLIKIMRNAPKPMLIHCKAGANRTSLATALYMAGIKETDERTAEAQMSFRFGNFPRWLGSSSRMSENFEMLEDMFGYGGS